MRIINKKKFARFVIIVLAMALFVGFIVNDKHKIVGYESYFVTDGDTLWDIAKQSNGYDHIDIRDIIYDIQQASNISSDIQWGDEIQIPIYEED